MIEEKEVKENKLDDVTGGQTSNKSKEEELGGDIHISPTDDHIIPSFEDNK